MSEGAGETTRAVHDPRWARLVSRLGTPTPEFYARVSVWANASDAAYRTLLYVVGTSVDLESGTSTYKVQTFARLMDEALRKQGHDLPNVSKSTVERRIRELVKVGLLSRVRRKDVVADPAGRKHFRERSAVTTPDFGMTLVDGGLQAFDFFADLEQTSVTDSQTDSQKDSATDDSSVAAQSICSSSNGAAAAYTPLSENWWSIERAEELADIMQQNFGLPGIIPSVLHKKWKHVAVGDSDEFLMHLKRFIHERDPQNYLPGWMVQVFPDWLGEMDEILDDEVQDPSHD